MGATRRLTLVVALATVSVGLSATPAAASARVPAKSATAGSRTGVTTDRVIVGVRRTERAAAVAAVDEAGGEIVDYSRPGGFLVVETSSEAGEWADAVEGDAAVRYAEPDWKLSAADLTMADPRREDLWGLRQIGAPRASTASGTEVIVAVIDSGVDYTHEDLADQMWINPGEDPTTPGDDDGNGWANDVYGIDCVNEDADPMDDNGHGTHVAGTIAATPDNGKGVLGAAPNVKVMALKFLGEDGTGYTSDAIQCLEYAVANGAHITNNSWGGPSYSQALYDAIAEAREKNQLFVAAAGNDASDDDLKPHYPASYALDNVISVAATDREDRLAGFSNHGATSVDLAAPGVGILSTVPGGYGFYSGTSMATPHVSGAAALLAGADAALLNDVSTMRSALLDRVEPVPALEGQVATGGRLDLAGSDASALPGSVDAPAGKCKRGTSRRGCRRPR